jgi:hypothetical protein
MPISYERKWVVDYHLTSGKKPRQIIYLCLEVF